MSFLYEAVTPLGTANGLLTSGGLLGRIRPCKLLAIMSNNNFYCQHFQKYNVIPSTLDIIHVFKQLSASPHTATIKRAPSKWRRFIINNSQQNGEHMETAENNRK